MEIIEVKSQDEVNEFINLPIRLYKHEPHWIRPIDKDIEDVFHADTNKFFRHGECTRWILKDTSGNNNWSGCRFHK